MIDWIRTASALCVTGTLVALTACSSAPDDTSTTDDALIRGGGGGTTTQACVWPLANPVYCPTQNPTCVVKQYSHPTEQQYIDHGCAKNSIDVDWSANPSNGPFGVIFGTYVLCPESYVRSLGFNTSYQMCNKCLPAEPLGQKWFMSSGGIGPCQSGCHHDLGTVGDVSLTQ